MRRLNIKEWLTDSHHCCTQYPGSQDKHEGEWASLYLSVTLLSHHCPIYNAKDSQCADAIGSCFDAVGSCQHYLRPILTANDKAKLNVCMLRNNAGDWKERRQGKIHFLYRYNVCTVIRDHKMLLSCRVSHQHTSNASVLMSNASVLMRHPIFVWDKAQSDGHSCLVRCTCRRYIWRRVSRGQASWCGHVPICQRRRLWGPVEEGLVLCEYCDKCVFLYCMHNHKHTAIWSINVIDIRARSMGTAAQPS